MAETVLLHMQLSPPIPGESVVKDVVGWIELNDWNWRIRRNAEAAGAQSIEPSTLTFSKRMDTATTPMLKAMSLGTLMDARIRMDDVSMHLVSDGTPGELRHVNILNLLLTGVRITGYGFKTEVEDKSTRIEEDWTFDYASVKFEYQPLLLNGEPGGVVNSPVIQRPPGAKMTRPDDKLEKFLALAKDMSVQSLDKVWKEVRKQVEQAERGEPDAGKKTEEKDKSSR